MSIQHLIIEEQIKQIWLFMARLQNYRIIKDGKDHSGCLVQSRSFSTMPTNHAFQCHIYSLLENPQGQPFHPLHGSVDSDGAFRLLQHLSLYWNTCTSYLQHSDLLVITTYFEWYQAWFLLPSLWCTLIFNRKLSGLRRVIVGVEASSRHRPASTRQCLTFCWSQSVSIYSSSSLMWIISQQTKKPLPST